jgi:protein-L-isoaspartate O-methyltransferase
MSLLRNLPGGQVSNHILIALMAIQSLLPQFAGAASPPASFQRSSQGKRVYTNDDLPSGDAMPERSAAGGESSDGKPVSGPSGGEKVAPYVPSPMEIVDRMLELAGTTARDVVYDMGSGDGRIVLRAAQKYGARSVGVEIDHRLAVESAEKAKELKLDKLATIIEGDMFQTNLQSATVVTVYLILYANERLRPVLEKGLRPGTRVVSHDTRIPGWEAAKEETFNVGVVPHTIYLYDIPGAFQKKGQR